MSLPSDITLGANLSGTSFRTELNAILAALGSTNISATAPDYKVAGTLWLDSATSPLNILKIYDGTDWISIGTVDATNNKFKPAYGVYADFSNIYAASSAGSDTYAITTAQSFTAYVTGMMILFKADVANTGAATLNVDSVGAQAIKKQVSLALDNGDITADSINIVIWDGTNWQLVSNVPTKITLQTFTADGTWTKPTGCKRIIVELVGAGGGGGGSNTTDSRCGGGGGGGGYGMKLLDATSLTTETVTIGAGGTAGTSTGSGGDGGTTSFGAHISITGGTGGSVGSTGGVVAAGGVSTGGDVNITGFNGGVSGNSLDGSILGCGGASAKGFGPHTGDSVVNTAGIDGKSYGGGGRGGNRVSTTARAGGAGAKGICLVWEFY